MHFYYLPTITKWTIRESNDDYDDGKLYSESYTIEELHENLNEIVYDDVKNKALRKELVLHIAKAFNGETYEYYESGNSKNLEKLFKATNEIRVFLELLFSLKFGVDEDTYSHVDVLITDHKRYFAPICIPRYSEYVKKPTDAIRYYRLYGNYLSDGMRRTVLLRINELLKNVEVNE